MRKTTKADELAKMAISQGKNGAASVEQPAAIPEPVTAKQRPGRTTSVYLTPEDDAILKSRRVMFASQGMNITDAHIIRAALRLTDDVDMWTVAAEIARREDKRYAARSKP